MEDRALLAGYPRCMILNGVIILVAITRTTILTPYQIFKSLHSYEDEAPIHRFHLQGRDLQMNHRDLTMWRHARIVAVAVSVTKQRLSRDMYHSSGLRFRLITDRYNDTLSFSIGLKRSMYIWVQRLISNIMPQKQSFQQFDKSLLSHYYLHQLWIYRCLSARLQ